MLDITTWFRLGTVGMVAGTLAMAWVMRPLPRERYREGYLLVAVGLIAAVAYGLMSMGLGTVTATDGHTVYLARYVDWLLTTPIHVVYLGLLAGVSRRLLAELSLFQAATIALGLAGAFFGGLLQWALFLAGSLAFGRVLYLLYGECRTAVETAPDMTVGLYRKLLNFIAVLWLVYPIIWVLAPSGLGLMDLETQSLVVSYIDVVAKIGFGLIALNGQRIITYLDRDAAGETGGDVVRRTGAPADD